MRWRRHSQVLLDEQGHMRLTDFGLSRFPKLQEPAAKSVAQLPRLDGEKSAAGGAGAAAAGAFTVEGTRAAGEGLRARGGGGGV